MKYTKFVNKQPEHLKLVPFVDAAPLMQPWEKYAWAFLVVFFLTLWLAWPSDASANMLCTPDKQGGMICKPCPPGIWCY